MLTNAAQNRKTRYFDLTHQATALEYRARQVAIALQQPISPILRQATPYHQRGKI